MELTTIQSLYYVLVYYFYMQVDYYDNGALMQQ